MIVQDLTKLVVVMVVLGLILAIAVFRPQVLPVLSEGSPPEAESVDTLSYDELLAWQDDLERLERALEQQNAELLEDEAALHQRREELENLEAQLHQLRSELDERETALEEREAELVSSETILDQRQAELDDQQDQLDQLRIELEERQAALEQREAELVEDEAALLERRGELEGLEAQLHQHRIDLAQYETALDRRDALLNERETRLEEREVNLAQREQRVRGLLRWSLTAVVVSGLTAAPSIVVLTALAQQKREAVAQRESFSWGESWERLRHQGRKKVATGTLPHGSNGSGSDREE